MTRLNFNKLKYKKRKRRGLPRANPWSPAEIRFLIDNYPSMEAKEISVQIGRTISAIRYKAGMLGIKKINSWTNTNLKS